MPNYSGASIFRATSLSILLEIADLSSNTKINQLIRDYFNTLCRFQKALAI